MNLRSSRFLLVPALALIFLLAQPAALWSQCSVATTGVNDFGSIISVYKILNTAGTCVSVGNMNVNACFPTTSPNFTVFLAASAPSAAMMPSCSFVCDCGTVTGIGFTIDSTDGLPVELMDFAVEDDSERASS